jgi:diacylglycerol kinase (ATP)
MTAKTCVIFNPVARGEKAAGFRAHLTALSHTCALWPTTGPGAATQLAAQAVHEGFETVIAAGGDGTVNEVVNGLALVPEALPQVRFGVLPLGTVNVFARELGLPLRWEAAWQILQRGQDLAIDAGVAQYTDAGVPRQRWFLQIAGAGWDARAIALTSWELKKKIGPLAYVLAGLQAMRGPQANVTVTDGQTTLVGPMALIGNGRFYGGNWRLFPRADLRDGLLDVTVFPRLNPWAVGRGCLGVLLNRVYTTGGAAHLCAPEFELTSTAPLPFHVEAENTGTLPVRFSVRPRAVRVIVP